MHDKGKNIKMYSHYNVNTISGRVGAGKSLYAYTWARIQQLRNRHHIYFISDELNDVSTLKRTLANIWSGPEITAVDDWNILSIKHDNDLFEAVDSISTDPEETSIVFDVPTLHRPAMQMAHALANNGYTICICVQERKDQL